MNKTGLALLSLVFSVMLWLVAQSQGQETSRDFSSVPLEYRGLSEDLVVLGGNEPKVTLLAKGPKDLIDQIRSDDLRPYVDLSKAVATNKAFPVQLDRAARDKLHGVVWDLPRPQLSIVAIAERHDLKVTVVTVGSFAMPNLTYQNSTVEPEKVTIRGPEKEVHRVYKAQVLLDLTTANNGMPQSQAVELLDKDNAPITDVYSMPKEVTIRPVVAAADQSRMLLVTPSFAGSQPEFGYRVSRVSVTPPQVLVGGSSEALASLKSATVDTEKIDLTGLMQSVTFTVDLDTSKLRGVHPLQKRRVQVRVQIEPTIAPPPH